VLVDGAVLHLVGVAEALGVAAGVVGEVGDVLVETRRAALQHLVRTVAPADLDLVRLLQVPAHAAAGAVDAEREAALPAGGHLRDAGIGVHAVGKTVARLAELQQDAAEVLGVDLVRHHRLGIGLGKGLHLAARAQAGLVEGFEVGEDALGAAAEDEADGVDPVRADVAHRPQLAALGGEQAPVVVGLMQQPVLEEVALDVDDLAEVAARDHGAHLQDGGEEAAHVVDREHRALFAALLDRGDDAGGFGRGHAQGFFTDDVLALGEGVEALLNVGLVGRGDVDDVNVRAAVQGAVVVVAVDFRDAPEVGQGAGALRRAADGADLDAETAQGFDVDGAMKPVPMMPARRE